MPVSVANAPARTNPALIGLPSCAARSLAGTSTTWASSTATGRWNRLALTTTTAPGASFGRMVSQNAWSITNADQASITMGNARSGASPTVSSALVFEPAHAAAVLGKEQGVSSLGDGGHRQGLGDDLHALSADAGEEHLAFVHLVLTPVASPGSVAPRSL